MCKSGAEKLNNNLKQKYLWGLLSIKPFEDDSWTSEAIV